MRWAVTTLAAAAALVGSTLAAPGASAAVPTPPDRDPFYSAPADLPAHPNGAVLRSRQVTVTGLGIPLPVRSWQVLYRSTDSHGQPVADATTIMVPAIPWFGGGPRPLLSYQTAEDSLGTVCAPSYTLRAGIEKELGLIAPALLRGWAVTVPDYEGPQSQYGAGAQAGHAVLDGVKAALAFGPAGFRPTTPVGLMGYSGGGLATGWAAELQGSYAPGLNVVGVAEGGTPADLRAAFGVIDGSAFAGLGFGAIVGLSRAYPEVDLPSVLNAAGAQAVRDVAQACVAELAIRYPFLRLDSFTTVPGAVDLPQFAGVLAATKLGQHTPVAPIFNYHSILDELIPIATDDALVAKYCAAGVRVQHYRDLLSEHNILAVTGAPLAISYLADRFAGRPAPSNC
jgi:hypothetical protein